MFVESMRLLMFICALGAAWLTGCGRAPAPDRDADGPYRVVATTGMLADVVRQVAGEHASVEQLMDAGVDPHLYQPTRNDVILLQNADVIFYNGLLLEGKMTDTFARMAREKKRVHAVAEALPKEFLLSPDDQPGHPDPHVWMDVSAWSEVVAEVAERLAAYDSVHAEVYRANATAYQKELTALDEYVKRVIASVPENQRILVTAHDAFSYFGRAYDIRVEGIQGISTEAEAGLKDINRLIDLIIEKKVQAVFVETSVADRNVRALVEGSEARGHALKIGGSLFSDAMGAAGTYEGTYIGMLDHNATTIARGLGGEAPPRGMQGRLAP